MGICSYSDSKAYLPLAIVSIDHGQDIIRQAQFTAWLADRDIAAKKVFGQYVMKDTGQAVFEPSWVMSQEMFNQYILGTAWIQDQETVLFLGPTQRRYCDVGKGREQYTTHVDVRPARLLWVGKGLRYGQWMGFFHETSRERALDVGEFTVELPKGIYYTCTPMEGTREHA